MKLKIKFVHIKFIFSLLIIVALVLIIWDFEFENIAFNLSVTRILMVIVVLVFSLILRAYRWQLLMNNKTNNKLSFLFSFKLLLIGQALNVIMPAGTGDIAKGYFGYKQLGQKERMFAVSIFDKLVAIASVGLLAIYASIVTKEYIYLLLVIVSITPFLIILYINKLLKVKLVAFFYKRISNRFKRVDLDLLIQHLSFTTQVILKAFLISLFAWIFTYLLLYYSFSVFNVNISFAEVLVFSPILTLARLFPLTLNGVGSDEALMIFLFSSQEIGMSTVLVSSLFYRLLTMVFPALIGLFIIMFLRNKNKTPKII